jgi:hypothetical protein
MRRVAAPEGNFKDCAPQSQAYGFSRLPIRPHVSAAPPASLAGKPRLQIGQAHVIRPSIAADRRPVTAMIIRAIDQHARISARALSRSIGKWSWAVDLGFDVVLAPLLPLVNIGGFLCKKESCKC